jgi:hypothetical protein
VYVGAGRSQRKLVKVYSPEGGAEEQDGGYQAVSFSLWIELINQ